MKNLIAAACLGLGALWLVPGSAQTVYRCGSAYSSQPCADAKIVAADDPRSGAQQAEARRLADEERRRGDRMEQERVAAAAANIPAGAGSLSPPPAVKAKTSAHGASVVHRRHPHKAKPDDDPNRFSAAEPGSGKKKPRAPKA
jgi:hypothetical protein